MRASPRRTRRLRSLTALGALALALLLLALASVVAPVKGLVLDARASGAGVGWTTCESGVTVDLHDVSSPDSLHAYAVGESGTIIGTVDGGSHWNRYNSGTSVELFGVSFPDAQHGWVAGTAGIILATSNGGATWTRQASGTSTTLRAIAFADANHGWAVGGDGEGGSGFILRTANGGATWTQVYSDPWKHMCSISFADAQNGWIVGTHNVVTDQGSSGGGSWMTVRPDPLCLRTSDGGSSWIDQTISVYGPLKSVSCVDALHGWIGRERAEIWSTGDGGSRWVQQQGELPPYWTTSYTTSDVAFADADHGWTIADKDVYATLRGGAIWRSQTSGSPQVLNAIACADAMNVWAVGKGGVVLCTRTGGFAPGDDITPPTTTASVPDGSWLRARRAVFLTAKDEAAGSGMTGGFAKTEWRLDSKGPWRAGNKIVLSRLVNDGLHTVTFRSTDASGNIETNRSLSVGLDTLKPYIRSPHDLSCRRGYAAKFRFMVCDYKNGCGYARAKIRIRPESSKRVVKTIVVPSGRSNRMRTYACKVKLKSGRYTWTVQPTDLAGNPGTTSRAASLIVR